MVYMAKAVSVTPSNDVSGSSNFTGTATTGSWLDAKFVPELSSSIVATEIIKITVDMDPDTYGTDLNGVRAFTNLWIWNR